MRLAAGAALALVLAACTADDTAIRLTLDGDLQAGTDFDGIDLTMSREAAQVWSDSHALGGGDRLPLAFEIRPTSEGDEWVEIGVSATLDGASVLRAAREAAFARGETVGLRICLLSSCLGEESARCGEGRCPGDLGGDGDADADLDADGEFPGDVARDDGADDADGTPEMLCADSCSLAGDGTCQDGGESAVSRWCAYGEDCTDCGPRERSLCRVDCENRECGDDGCGGSCGEGCAGDAICAPGGSCVTWVTVPGGTFAMGSTEAEVGRSSVYDETSHQVTITRDFLLTAREVSRDWFEAVMGWDPSLDPGCADCPVHQVSWGAAAAFCNALSAMEGLPLCYRCTGATPTPDCGLSPELSSPYDCDGYRLPTEAEWELAARAGTETATYVGDLVEGRLMCETPNPELDPIAWFCGNAGSPMPRGLLRPNDLGLFDMLGNVNELVHDYFAPYASGSPAEDPFGPTTGARRSFRGGCVWDVAGRCRAAARGNADPSLPATTSGFRPARPPL